MLLIVSPATFILNNFVHLFVNSFFNLQHLLLIYRLFGVDKLVLVIHFGYSMAIPLLVIWSINYLRGLSLQVELVFGLNQV